MTSTHAFDVLLGDVPVGRLALDLGGQASFTFFDSYRRRYPRPVLGQMFEDNLFGRYVGKGRLPVWFSNLLPEGPLRERAQKQLGRRRKHEIFLLAGLVDDLPGAVRIGPATGEEDAKGSPDYEANQTGRADDDEERIRFSLAGVQDKVPVVRLAGGVFSKIPGGVGGMWIAKLPDAAREGVPVNEHAMMTWAKLAGLDVPDIELVSAIEHLDPARFLRGEPALVVRRFDRDDAERRIHIEDMAQVFGQYAGDKYASRSYEDIARVVLAVGGAESLDEFVRRLVFVIASGNHDMHLKNWSLVYPDGVHARLSPAYDLVATVAYPDVSDELALKLAGSRRWSVIQRSFFERFAKDVGADVDRILGVVDNTIDALARTRERAAQNAQLPEAAWQRIDHHWSRMPLLRVRA
jgi:serine/threonine-protein kinase HipA